MRNPWLKRNPFMSMWLSGANSVLGASRAHLQAEGRRQSTRMMTEATRQAMRFWTGALLAPPATNKKRKR